jgi:hypothetical protein
MRFKYRLYIAILINEFKMISLSFKPACAAGKYLRKLLFLFVSVFFAFVISIKFASQKLYKELKNYTVDNWNLWRVFRLMLYIFSGKWKRPTLFYSIVEWHGCILTKIILNLVICHNFQQGWRLRRHIDTLKTRMQLHQLKTRMQLRDHQIGNYTVREVLIKNRTRVWRNIYNSRTSVISYDYHFIVNFTRAINDNNFNVVKRAQLYAPFVNFHSNFWH